MTAKRKRENSSASVKKEDLGEQSLAGETEEKPEPQASETVPASKRNVIVITNDEEPSMTDGGPANSAAVPVSAEDQPLLSIDKCFKEEHLWLINALLRQPVAIGDAICHLSQLPADAKWNVTNTLSTASGRAIVIVAFGSLSSVNLAIARGKAATLSIAIDLLREKDVESLKSVYDLAQVPKRLASAATHLAAHRTSADPRSRVMNVYDQTEQLLANPKDKMESLGVNALIGGDVIRMDMRCVRLQDAGTPGVQFKLKSAHLVLAVPRAVDSLA